MSRLFARFRISTKLVGASLVGILFVAAMILNQILADANVERGISKAIDQQEMARQAGDAKGEARRMQVFVRDLRLARSQADIKAGEDNLAAAGKDADRLAESMYRRSVSTANKTRIEELRKSRRQQSTT